MKVNHMNVLGAAYVQQVQPHPLLLVHSQARQVVDHPINGCKDRELQSIKNLCTSGKRKYEASRSPPIFFISLHAQSHPDIVRGPLYVIISVRG